MNKFHRRQVKNDRALLKEAMSDKKHFKPREDYLLKLQNILSPSPPKPLNKMDRIVLERMVYLMKRDNNGS